MTTAATREQRHHSRFLAITIGGLLPLAIALVPTWLMVSWLPELPDPIAIHWSGPTPDGYGPALPMIFLPLGIVLAYSAFAVGVSWTTTPSGRPQWTQKFVLVTGSWLSSLLAIGIAGSVAMQRGLTDARDAGDVGGALLWGGAVGLVLATAAWFLLPKADRSAPSTGEAAPIALTGTEHVSWFGTVRLARGAIVVIVAALVVSLGTVVLMLVTAPEGVGFALAAFVTLLLLALFTASWRVTVDRRGLRTVGALGWPRVMIALDDIREVHAITVDPTAEFGGWGWRWDGAGRSGLIMRRGPAIQVTRTSGKRFVVTVDDAETAASVLAALSSPHRLK